MDFWDVLWTATGAGLILLMLVDVFHTLLYPHGSGPVCRTIMHGFWRLSRLSRTGSSSIAAPAAMAAVIGAWATMAVLGWAFLYLPHLPEGFIYGDRVPRQADFPEAVYISMVTLSTVGFGEVVAGHPLLRLVSAAQAVMGFGLLTATVSWILQMYPALNRRRALAHQLNLFREAASPGGPSTITPGHAAALLESLAGSVAAVSIDLLAFHETYYFQEVEQRGSLPATVTYAQQLASEAKASDNTDLQFAGRMLEAALDDLAKVLRGRFGHAGTTSTEVFEHYSTHHRHRRSREAGTP
ncbi:potassium channel family protein [Arthrobacter sp. NPDC056493]|uniref:potassium channel family protein n=1 Tax=Arthrobacter sp. NPDC056493 TaxID=3345839 RepID=UPI0036716BE3